MRPSPKPAVSALSEDVVAPGTAHADAVGEILVGAFELTHLLNSALTIAGADRVKSNADLIVLTTLRLEGPQRPRDLVAATQLTSGGMTNLVDRLTAEGLVRRVREVESDRRGVLVALTSHGDELVARFATAVGEVLTLAAPLFERWRSMFVALGIEVGPTPSPARSPRRDLERIRRISSAGRYMWPIYLAVLGDDDPTPHLTVHVLWLASRPGGVRPRKIGEITRLKSATTTDLIDRIEARGLVSRTGSTRDRRAVIVIATEAGRATLDDVIDRAHPVMGALAGAFFPR